MKTKTLFFGFFLLGILPSFVQAEVLPGTELFQSKQSISFPDLQLPTFVKIALPNQQPYGVGVLEEETQQFQPWKRLQKTNPKVLPQPSLQSSSGIKGAGTALLDDNFQTTVDFPLEEKLSRASVSITFDQAITTSRLSLYLADHVAYPQTIALYALDSGSAKTIIAPKKFTQSSLFFLKTSARSWRIDLTYVQPLRLKEIVLEPDHRTYDTTPELIFLARPGNTYTLYTDPLRRPNISVGESPAFTEDSKKMVFGSMDAQTVNPFFIEPDQDEDGVRDALDNCVSVANADQTDIDNNGLGEACEDRDGDRVVDSKDNCPSHPNRRQTDTDGDGQGDACDGEESRFTEANPWVPWLGIGAAFLVVIFVMYRTFQGSQKS